MSESCESFGEFRRKLLEEAGVQAIAQIRGELAEEEAEYGPHGWGVLRVKTLLAEVDRLTAELSRVRERKYYHRVEIDGQAVEVGFQTCEELAEHLGDQTMQRGIDAAAAKVAEFEMSQGDDYSPPPRKEGDAGPCQ